MFWRRHPVRDDELSAYIDGELDESRRTRVKAHLGECTACRETLEQLRSVRLALSTLPRVDAPRSFALREADLAPAPRVPLTLGRAPAFLGSMAAFALIALFVLVGVDLSDGSSTPTAGPGTSTTFNAGYLDEFESAEDAAALAPSEERSAGGEENAIDAGAGEDGATADAGTEGDGGLPMTSGVEPPAITNDSGREPADLEPAEPEALPDVAEPEANPGLAAPNAPEQPLAGEPLAGSDDGPNLRAAEAAAAALAIVALGSLALVWWRRRVSG